MAHSHHHGHHHSASGNLKIAFWINFIFTIFEFIGGVYVNSIAIISDAVHDLGDSISLGLAWFLQNKSQQKANKKFTFGYTRFSLLGALINSLVLIVGSIYVVSEAVGRILNPEHSNALGMLAFAIVGILANGYGAWKVSSGKTINERVVSWHLLEDVLGWVAVLIVAITLQFIDIHYLDPALSLLISIYILWNALKNLKEALFLFLQGQPQDISREEIEGKICELNHVDSIHHTQIWSLDGEKHVFSTHVKLRGVQSLKDLLNVKKQIREIMKVYRFHHFTIETELEEEFCEFREENSGVQSPA